MALVTGGSGDIGSAVVAYLLEAGAAVVSLDLPGRDVPAAAEGLPCDLADPAAITRAMTGLTSHHRHIDIFVHCAGITRDAVLWKMAKADWDTVVRVNLDSAFHILQALTPGMRAAERGTIVLVSSVNGERGKFGQANYAASKAGLIGLGKTAAKELGPKGIRVNIVSPGLIRTRMTADLPPDVWQRAVAESALGKAGEPQDVARAVLFLCSDLSSHVTGQVLRVDGGQCMA